MVMHCFVAGGTFCELREKNTRPPVIINTEELWPWGISVIHAALLTVCFQLANTSLLFLHYW